MSKFLKKSVETYRIDTEEEVLQFQEEIRNDNTFDLTKFQWSHKITKSDDYFQVSVEKTFYTDEDFE